MIYSDYNKNTQNRQDSKNYKTKYKYKTSADQKKGTNMQTKTDINKLNDAQLILYLMDLPAYEKQQIFNETYVNVYDMAKDMQATRKQITSYVANQHRDFVPGEIITIMQTKQPAIYIKKIDDQQSEILDGNTQQVTEIETWRLRATNKKIDLNAISKDEDSLALIPVIKEICV